MVIALVDEIDVGAAAAEVAVAVLDAGGDEHAGRALQTAQLAAEQDLHLQAAVVLVAAEEQEHRVAVVHVAVDVARPAVADVVELAGDEVERRAVEQAPVEHDEALAGAVAVVLQFAGGFLERREEQGLAVHRRVALQRDAAVDQFRIEGAVGVLVFLHGQLVQAGDMDEGVLADHRVHR